MLRRRKRKGTDPFYLTIAPQCAPLAATNSSIYLNPNKVFKEDHYPELRRVELPCCLVDYRWDGADHRRDIGERNHEEAVLERSQRMTANTAFHGIMGTSTGPHPYPAPQVTMPPGRVPDMMVYLLC